MGKNSPNRIKVFLSTPMPAGDTHWKFLRESIDAFFAYSDLNSLFELTIIETEGGQPPANVYTPMVGKADVLLAVFGEKIPPGQYDEIVKAKELSKIIFGFYLCYQPMVGSGENNHSILYGSSPINPISNHYDLFSSIRTQLLGFFSHAIGDVKIISPAYIESELSTAYDEDSDELLTRVGSLFHKIGVEDNDVYLMAIIYSIKCDFEFDKVIDDRLIKMSRSNFNAWMILLLIAFKYGKENIFDICTQNKESFSKFSLLNELFTASNDSEYSLTMLNNKNFIDSAHDLSAMEIYSCPVFEDVIDNILKDY